jgi:hypothetical protein
MKGLTFYPNKPVNAVCCVAFKIARFIFYILVIILIRNNDFVAKIVDRKNDKKVILIVLYEPSIQIFN